MAKTEELVFNMAQPFAAREGCEILEVEYKKEGSDYHLRVYLDKDEGSVDLDTCEKVSRALSDELDKKDPIKESYILEVCSPGIDRQLKRDKDFMRFMGRKVDVKLFAPKDGKKEFEGILKSYEEGTVTIASGKEDIEIKKDEAVYIKLHVEF